MDTTEHAVVLGGSIAGLLAARVLSESHRRVTIVERDHLPVDDAQRRGVPQGRHLHSLMAAGAEALEELFPGFVAEMAQAGAHVGDVQDDARWFIGPGCYRRGASGLRAIAASRPLLEAHVRQRVRDLPGVVFLEGHEVRGLAAADGRVHGVRLGRCDHDAEQVLPATLVVDASGRGSHLPVWLEEVGHTRPRREEARIGLGYTTRHYRLGRDELAGDLAVIVASRPDAPRGGALMLQEHGQAVVTLIGYVGDHAPTDPQGFLGFAESLRVGDIHALLRGAEPLDDPVRFRIPAGVRHRYEELADLPDGLLVVGDAWCSFNPMYAQGMTVAALQALVLRDCLRLGDTSGLARRFFRRAGRVVDQSWDAVVSSDLQIPGTQVPRVRGSGALNAWLARVHAAAASDPHVARAFLRVSNMVAPPTGLLRPGVALRVLRAGLRGAPAPAAAQASPSSRSAAL